MRERDLLQLFLVGGLFAAGCSAGRTEVPASNLPIPTPTINPLALEMQSNDHLVTLADKERYMAATAQPNIGLDWEKLEAQGLSKRAVETSTELVFLDQEKAGQASGNFLRYKDDRDGLTYSIIVTGGHFLQHLSERMKVGEQSFYSSRDDSFENHGIARFDASRIGISFINDDTFDIGFVAIREDIFEKEWLGDTVENMSLDMSELSFAKRDANERYSSVCTPGFLDPKPTISIESRVNLIEPTDQVPDVSLDDSLEEAGCTGALFFDEEDKATAVTVSVTDYEKSSFTAVLIYADNTDVYFLSDLGESPEKAQEEFIKLVRASIDDFNSRNP